MKTERRRDLETNELAQRLNEGIEQVKPYTGPLIAGAVLIVLFLAGISWWNSYTASREEAAWDEFALARMNSDPELKRLQQIADAEDYSGSEMQQWAYLDWADRQLSLASRFYLVDREAAYDRLRSIAGIYQQLATSASEDDLRQRARFGLARVYELQNKVDQAREQYLQVNGELRALAAERAARLESEKVQQNIDWLATAELPERDPDTELGAQAARPEFDATLPSTGSEGTPQETRSLDEILGDFTSGLDQDDRYGTADDAESAEETFPEADGTESMDDFFNRYNEQPPTDTVETESADETSSAAEEETADQQ